MSNDTPTQQEPSLATTVPRVARYVIRRPAFSAALTVSALSVVLTVWAAVDLVGAKIPGTALGLFLDLVVIAAVVVAWRNLSRTALYGASAVALLSVAVVGYHGYALSPFLLVLGGVPALSGLLWHLLLSQRHRAMREEQQEAERISRKRVADRAEEEKFCTEPDAEQRAEVARRWRDLNHRMALADVQRAEDRQNHQEELDRILRQSDAEVARTRAEARAEIAQIVADFQKVHLSRSAALEVEVTDLGTVPDTPAGIQASSPPPPAGFGAALNEISRARQPVKSPRPRSRAPRPQGQSGSTKTDRVQQLLKEGGRTRAEIAREVGCSPSLVTKISHTLEQK